MSKRILVVERGSHPRRIRNACNSDIADDREQEASQKRFHLHVWVSVGVSVRQVETA